MPQANPQPPGYKQTGATIRYLNKGFIIKGGTIRLTIPKQQKEYLAKKHDITADYLYLRIPDEYTGYHGNLKMIEIIPLLHKWPFGRIKQLLLYKAEDQGIQIEMQEESFTSQCSPYTAEVSEQYAHKSNRKHRDPYVIEGNAFNADCVGAYNIMRKYLCRIGRTSPAVVGLDTPMMYRWNSNRGFVLNQKLAISMTLYVIEVIRANALNLLAGRRQSPVVIFYYSRELNMWYNGKKCTHGSGSMKRHKGAIV